MWHVCGGKGGEVGVGMCRVRCMGGGCAGEVDLRDGHGGGDIDILWGEGGGRL